MASHRARLPPVKGSPWWCQPESGIGLKETKAGGSGQSQASLTSRRSNMVWE